VLEGVLWSCRDVLMSGDFDTTLFHPQIELVIFETPAPISIAEPIQLDKVFARQNQNTTNKIVIVVFGVSFGAGHMKGIAFFRETVPQLRIDGDQVNVMHYYVVILG